NVIPARIPVLDTPDHDLARDRGRLGYLEELHESSHIACLLCREELGVGNLTRANPHFKSVMNGNPATARAVPHVIDGELLLREESNDLLHSGDNLATLGVEHGEHLLIARKRRASQE